MSTVIYHNHHIIPKHAGGTNAPDNIARLTVEEHSEAHRLLYEKYGRWQDKIAWLAIAGHIGKEEIIREKQYQNGKDSVGRKCSLETRKILSEIGKNYTFTTEHRKNISKSKEGHEVSEETRKKISKTKSGSPSNRKGVTLSPETKKKISDSLKGRWAK